MLLLEKKLPRNSSSCCRCAKRNINSNSSSNIKWGDDDDGDDFVAQSGRQAGRAVRQADWGLQGRPGSRAVVVVASSSSSSPRPIMRLVLAACRKE